MSSPTIQFADGVLPPDVKYKIDVVNAWHRGVFGNKLKSWHSLAEIGHDGYWGEFRIRFKHVDNQRKDLSRRTFNMTQVLWLTHKLKHFSPSEYYFMEVPDDNLILLQGEIARSERWWELRYSVVTGLCMKDALVQDKEDYAHGMRAWHLATHHMDPSSRSDLEELFDAYPDAVVEFGTWSYNLGDKKGRNTIIFEVREGY